MIFIAIYVGRKDFQICPRIGEWSNRDQSGIRASYIVNFLTPEGEHRLNYYVIYRWKGLWFGKSILRYRLCRRFDKNSLDSSDLLNCSFLRSSFVSFFFLPPLAIYGQISSSNPPHIRYLFANNPFSVNEFVNELPVFLFECILLCDNRFLSCKIFYGSQIYINLFYNSLGYSIQ